ncbi:hypothetical protein RJ55_03041 [Drechmeria coniospora]|nr:hypothetical protein RJ55_03041 [Drechmeria coniospora]
MVILGRVIPDDMTRPAMSFKNSAITRDPWNSALSFPDPYGVGGFGSKAYLPTSDIKSVDFTTAAFYHTSIASRTSTNGKNSRPEFSTSTSPSPSYGNHPSAELSTSAVPTRSSFLDSNPKLPLSWDPQGAYSPTGSFDDIIASPNLSDYSPGSKMKPGGKRGTQRRSSHRDEFDGPHQFLQRPPHQITAMQERELPHLPTNLHAEEQDSVMSQVNDRLSQCAFDFVAKYQFPIPLTQDMRPVERPQDRDWVEWVYLLKRLATKRRIPARLLYNGQIKQLVTILENSLELRHPANHQSRPLKDDRNILQLISAGIQVAKILKDASAMSHLDQLYVETEKRVQQRISSTFRP